MQPRNKLIILAFILGFFFLAPKAHAAISFLYGGGKGNANSIAMTGWNQSTISPGTFQVLQCSGGTAATSYQVADNLSDIFTQVGTTSASGAITWWTVTNGTESSFSLNTNVTSTAGFTQCNISAYTGVATTSPSVSIQNFSGTSITADTGAMGTTLGYLTVAEANSAYGISSNTWPSTGSFSAGGQFYDIATSTSIDFSFSNTFSEPWTMQVVMFQPPGSGGNPIQQLFNWILTFDW